MRILSWNCRGLGGSSIVAQLKESLRLNLPDVMFLCETKQNKLFMEKVVSKLQYMERWELVEPEGRKGGMMVAWSQNVTVLQVRRNEFCIEVKN